MSIDTGFITESVFVCASLAGGFKGTENLFRVSTPSLINGAFATRVTPALPLATSASGTGSCGAGGAGAGASAGVLGGGPGANGLTASVRATSICSPTAEATETTVGRLGEMRLSTSEGGFAYPAPPTKQELAAAAADHYAALATKGDPLLAIATGVVDGATAMAATTATPASPQAAYMPYGGVSAGAAGTTPPGTPARGAVSPQKSFRVSLTDHAVFDRSGSGPSGARFPAEIYTRGCHWIPRMFA
jgi:hypothetical protein